MTESCELFIKSNGRTAKVEWCGKDISNKLQGVSIDMHAGRLPTVTLDVVPTENLALDIDRATVEVTGGKATNADRIRSMTDEELAHELATRFSTDCNCCPAVDGCPVWSADIDYECEDSFLKWLKEAEE